MKTVHDDEDSNDSAEEEEIDDDDDDDEVENDEEEEESGDEEGEDGEKTIWNLYREEGASESSLPELRKYVIKRYITDVEYYNKFRRDSAHKQITATKRKFLDDADDNEKLGDYEALKLAVDKRQHLINEVSGLESDDEENNEEAND